MSGQYVLEWLQTPILLNGTKGMQELYQYSLISVILLLKQWILLNLA